MPRGKLSKKEGVGRPPLKEDLANRSHMFAFVFFHLRFSVLNFITLGHLHQTESSFPSLLRN